MRLQTRTLYEILGMVGIILISTFPFFHDIILGRDGLRGWVPDIGLEDFLTDSNGKIMGFTSYRVFVYTLGAHLFAHIGYLGWMMDAKGKYYRIALLVPVVLSGYTVAILLFNAKETAYNDTSTKLYLTLAITLAVLVYYVIDHRSETKLEKSRSENV